jgi:hypothetical protein
MVYSNVRAKRMLLVLVSLVLSPAIASGQYPQPASLSISPSFIYRPNGYTLCAGNGANMTLDIVYEFSGGGGGPIYGWPGLDASGCAHIYADSSTALGTYYFTAAKNTRNAAWVGMSASITVDVPPPPPPPPPNFSMSLSPSSRTVDQGGSAAFTMSVSPVNGFYSFVWLSISTALPPGVSASFNPNPVSPDGSSTLTITTSPSTPVGSFSFTVGGSGGGLTRDASGTATVNPRQPTSLSFTPSSGYAGNQPCYTMKVGNAPGMVVDLRYLIAGFPAQDTSISMDVNGEWHHCPGHYATTGVYSFVAIKNHARLDWVPIQPWATYTLAPPKPTSLSITPSVVAVGQQSFRMTVGNGAGLSLDTQYNFNGGPTETVFNWPSLIPVSPASPDGYVDVLPAPCSPPGTYEYTGFANRANGVWVSVSASVTINSSGPPSVTSVSLAEGIRGQSVEVTITGANLCGGPAAALTTTSPGLTFSNVQSHASSVRAVFNISSTASVGIAVITLTAGGGSTNFVFAINPSLGLTKEYIYLGRRILATEVP